MFHAHRTAFFWTLLTWTAFTPTTAAELPSACETPRTLLAQDQIRQGEGRQDEEHCYRLDLASSGLLHLHVSVDDARSPGVRFELLGSGAAFTPPRNLKRSAAERLSLIGAGTWFLAISAEDPRRPLPAYRLGSRLLEISKSETDGEIEIEAEESMRTATPIPCGMAKSETDGEIEIEAEESMRTATPIPCGTAKSETDGEIEIEAEESVRTATPIPCGTTKSETDGEIEIEAEESVRTPALDCDRARSLIARLCRAAAADDHGDTLACATPVVRRAEGELGNDWGDDADVFRFELRRWQTVEIITTGGVDTFGALLDGAGQLLAANDDRDEDEGFRLVRTLGPGTYFVRVEDSPAASLGTAGPYTLVVDELGR